jgi:hypothetical protein
MNTPGQARMVYLPSAGYAIGLALDLYRIRQGAPAHVMPLTHREELPCSTTISTQ